MRKKMASNQYAISGLGRIGRAFLRILSDKKQLDGLVCLNSSKPEIVGHLLAYDSVFGKYNGEIIATDKYLSIDGKKIPFINERNPKKIDWKKRDVDIVVDCTGAFNTQEKASLHLKSGAKKVLVSAPVKKADLTVCMGINEKDYDKDKHHIISAASCTTNCLAPLVKVLHQDYGIESGLMSTVHSYTTDQRLLDNSHKDLRRARAAAMNIVPTTTGAAHSISLVIPELKGKLNGISFRVPTPNGSLVDFTASLSKKASVEDINASFARAASGELSGILSYSENPLVLQDIIGDSHSSIFDSANTLVVGDSLIKVTAWYDNEWGYSCRLVDALQMIQKNLSLS